MLPVDVRIFFHDDDPKVLANVTATFEEFAIRGVRVINGPRGPFVSMPSQVRSGGQVVDLWGWTSHEAHKAFDQEVLRAYQEAAAEREPPEQ